MVGSKLCKTVKVQILDAFNKLHFMMNDFYVYSNTFQSMFLYFYLTFLKKVEAFLAAINTVSSPDFVLVLFYLRSVLFLSWFTSDLLLY